MKSTRQHRAEVRGLLLHGCVDLRRISLTRQRDQMCSYVPGGRKTSRKSLFAEFFFYSIIELLGRTVSAIFRVVKVENILGFSFSSAIAAILSEI